MTGHYVPSAARCFVEPSNEGARELPRRQICVLNSGAPTTRKARHLLSLLAWALLDQPGLRERGRDIRRTQRSEYLNKTMVLAAIFCSARTSVNRCKLHDHYSILAIKIMARGYSAEQMVSKGLMALARAESAYSIVSYLMRCKISNEFPDRRTLEDAKWFVHKWEDKCSISKISKDWEMFRFSAPFIFAFRSERSFRFSEHGDPDRLVDWALWFVRSERRVSRLIGCAAFASDAIARLSSSKLSNCFSDVSRTPPSLPTFTGEERIIISNIDRRAPIQ
jgi:hypothetical protein